MEIEIDMESVDLGVVEEVILIMTDALIASDHIDPTLEELFVAIGELMRMLLDDDDEETFH